MGGASTAAPLDAIGAIYWNPATISGLEKSETSFGVDLLFTDHQISSTIGPNSGTTDAEPGAMPIPNIGWVHHTEIPAVTVGLGVNAIAGFKTNLPASSTNPILAPAPGGLGRVSSEATFIQLAPVISLAVSDRMSVAAGPTITMGQLGMEPFVFAPANADGSYSPGQASRYHWGGGVQAGVYYIHDCNWHLGASIKSPTWFETFEFFGEDENGNPRVLFKDFELPLIASIGAAYNGIENTVIALDVRYFDYANAAGLGEPAVFNPTALDGLDWSSVLSVAAGVQRKMSDNLYVRAGYNFNQNPVKNSEAFFNIASPLIYEHTLSAGASLFLSENMAINVGYSHLFQNTRNGQVVLPGVGTVPGSEFENKLSAHFLSFGITMRN